MRGLRLEKQEGKTWRLFVRVSVTYLRSLCFCSITSSRPTSCAGSLKRTGVPARSADTAPSWAFASCSPPPWINGPAHKAEKSAPEVDEQLGPKLKPLACFAA